MYSVIIFLTLNNAAPPMIMKGFISVELIAENNTKGIFLCFPRANAYL